MAAAAHLRAARTDLEVEALDADLDAELARRLFAECDLVLDGTDNFETRYLLNDAAVEAGKPWVYAGAVGMSGAVVAVLPAEGPCLRCLFPVAPTPGSAPTCETAGILGPAASTAASLQAGEALKLLAGRADLWLPGLPLLRPSPGRLLPGLAAARSGRALLRLATVRVLEEEAGSAPTASAAETAS